MKNSIILGLSILLFTACKTKAQYNSIPVEKTFQKNIDAAVADDKLNLSGMSMTVIAPSLDINWTGASGYDSTEKNQLLSAKQPFRIASLTKTFVAAAILRLQEEDKLSLQDPISKYISPQHIEILKSDGYDLDAITIEQCLQHRSGLFDYAVGSEAYIQEALKDSNKRWTRTEQIQFAVTHGDPLGQPDTVFGYSDTGYVLLGEILEKLTGMGLAEALRSLLQFKKLGLTSTWLESLENRPEQLAESVHRYMEGKDMSKWDNSIDLYGGGGFSSTTTDLGVFINALFNGKVFKNEKTLQLMLAEPEAIPNSTDGSHYRMGLWRINVFDTQGFMHNGFWGTAWAHIPSMNSTIVVNYTNDTQGAGMLPKTARILKDMIDAKE